MGRVNGSFQIAVNFEPKIKGPFDGRVLVEDLADLTTAATWQDADENLWIYNGMPVVVLEAAHIGMYILKDAANFSQLASWEKIGSGGSDGKDTLQLDASASNVVDCSKYKHIEVSNVAANQQFALTNLEEGKTYSLLFHFSAAEANTINIATPLVTSQGKSPTVVLKSSLNDIIPGINYVVQMDVYAVSAAAFKCNAFHIY